jgi:putative transcriptional regulator
MSITPEQIRAAREAARLTQTAAAKLIFSTLRTWQDWEAGKRKMHKGLFKLFKLEVARLKRNRLIRQLLRN